MSNNNLKKIDIIKKLSNKTGFSQNFSKKIIEDLLKILLINIKNGNLILKNIGSFKVILKKKKSRKKPKNKRRIYNFREKILEIYSF